jgi:ribonuclease Z
MKADVIALTHYHGDHVFGLPGLMQTMEVFGRTQTLTLVGPSGLEAAMRPILELVGHTGYPVRLATLPEGGLRLGELARGWPEAARLTAFPTAHRVPSQGYCFTLDRAGKFLPDRARALGVPVNEWSLLQKGQRLQLEDGRVVGPEDVLGAPRKGLKFVFTGDTAPCDSLVDAAKGADLMICEATYGEDEQAQLAGEHGHMVFAQAAGIARRAGVKRLWLAHYSQMVEDPSAYLPNAAALFEDTVCGEDGLSVTLRFE